MNPFEYKRAGSVAEALREGRDDGAKFLAGGTNLVDLMKYDIESHKKLVDISRLPLGKIEIENNRAVKIGALVRNADLAVHPEIVQHYGVLSKALLAGASPQLRNLATTGGNLLQRTRCYYFYDTALPCNKREPGSGCGALEGFNRIHAILGQSDQCIAVHPSDMAVALTTLDALIYVEGPSGFIPLDEFYRLPGTTPHLDTNLEKGRLITAIELPAEARSSKSIYIKVRDRQSYAFALVSCAARIDVKGNPRIALGGVAHKPWRAEKAEDYMKGKPMTPENFRAAAEAELAPARGYEHNAFKIELTKRVIVRALTEIS